MDLHFSREDMIFRDQARTWLRDNLIRERRPHSGEAMRSFDLAWQRKQFEGGWAGVFVAHGIWRTWAVAHPPIDLGTRSTRAPPTRPDNHLCFVALNHAGPTPHRQRLGGSEAACICRKFSKARVIWCQGFSEPNSGSDLASLRTPGACGGRSSRRQRLRRSGPAMGILSDWQELLVAHRSRCAQAQGHQFGSFAI